MAHIDYYFTVLSPYAYLAGTRLEDIAKKHGASISYKPVNIMALFTEMGGTPPAQRHWSRKDIRNQELARISKRHDLKLNLAPAHWPTDQVPASKAIIAAQKAGQDAGALTHAVMRAVWAEEQNIGDADTVHDIMLACGIDALELEPAFAATADTFEANTAEAIERGAFGSPFYIIGDEKFWGQDRLSYVDEYLAGL